MFAAGLLGIGAVAIVVAFIVLFSAYLPNVQHAGSEWARRQPLRTLSCVKASIHAAV